MLSAESLLLEQGSCISLNLQRASLLMMQVVAQMSWLHVLDGHVLTDGERLHARKAMGHPVGDAASHIAFGKTIRKDSHLHSPDKVGHSVDIPLLYCSGLDYLYSGSLRGI